MSRRQALRITAVAGTSVALGGGLVGEILRRAGLHRVSETRTRMGTVVTVTVVHPNPDEARAMVGASFDEMERLEGIFSRHRTDTPLSVLNRDGALADPPPELVDVVRKATSYSLLTDGAFDVSVKPLLDLYEAAFAREGSAPGPTDVDAVRGLVDYRSIAVDSRGIGFLKPGMSITLDGIAKGFIVDRTVDVLTDRGADRVLINAGGDMASAGAGSIDDPWTVSIQDPRDEHRYVELLSLAGDCIATSGDYMRTFTEDRALHHIIDPRSGYSPAEASSVSVIAASAMEADALSTAALVLGPEKGRALLERLDGVEGVLVSKSGLQVRTSGVRDYTLL